MADKIVNDKIIDWVRQVVPVLWASLVTFLISKGLPAWVADLLGNATETIVLPLVVGAVYAVLVKVEPHLPTWLRAVLIGSAKIPTYHDHR